jgi:hypothetical protein
MPLVAKRKLNETWREAVARRARELAVEANCLKSFDELLGEGENEAAAAYKALSRFDALFDVPDGPVPGRREEV